MQDDEVLVHAQHFDEGSGEAVGRTFVAAADTGKRRGVGDRVSNLSLAPVGQIGTAKQLNVTQPTMLLHGSGCLQGSGRRRSRWFPAAPHSPSSGGRAAARCGQPWAQCLSYSTCPATRPFQPVTLRAPSVVIVKRPNLCPPLPPSSTPPQGKLKARVREYCALLRLQPPVVDQALHVLEQAIPSVMGNWRRDLLAASAAYAACRCEGAGKGAVCNAHCQLFCVHAG